jgi:hypothetical protein
MSQCVAFDANGFLVESTLCDYVLVTQSEYSGLNAENLLTLLDSYFKFDASLSAQIIGLFLVTFVVSHGLGRLVRIMGKHS